MMQIVNAVFVGVLLCSIGESSLQHDDDDEYLTSDITGNTDEELGFNEDMIAVPVNSEDAHNRNKRNAQFTQKEKNEAVSYHNFLRRSEDAASMRKMVSAVFTHFLLFLSF